MNSIDELTLLRGTPIKCADVCMVYSATMGEIADIGLNKFYQYLFLLTSDPQSAYKLKQPVPILSFLLMQSLINVEFSSLIQQAFEFFIHEKIHFLYETSEIQVGQDIQNRRSFTDDNYDQLVNILNIVYRTKKHNLDSDATSEKARQILQKIQKGQQQVKEIKAKKGTNDNDVDIDCLVSSLGLYYQNINIVWSLPYYTFFDQVARMQYKQNYDNNIVFSAAGAKIPKDKMKYWICKVQDSKGG